MTVQRPGPLLIGLDGPTLTPEEIELLAHPLIGGVILFERNYKAPAQLRVLIGALRARRSPLLVTVDQEGGRVQRLREEFTRLPSLGWLGSLYDRDPQEALSAARDLGWLMAVELRALDVDASFAPVLDVAGNTEIIGARAFHADPGRVATLGRAYIAGMREAGMGGTGKHFPGHGSVRGDSHLELPRDERPLAAIETRDLRPFAALAPDLAAVMTAHVVYPDFCEQPASFSRRWIGEVLRGRLGFAGAVVSDDLGMAGAVVIGDELARAEAALAAGCDLLLACNDRAAVLRLLDRLHWERPAGFDGRHAGLQGRGAPVIEPQRAERAQTLARRAWVETEGMSGMREDRLQEVERVWAEADCLYPAEAVAVAVARMAQAITADLAGRNPLVLCVMTGALLPTALLLQRLAFPLELDYLHATRYDGEIQGAALRWIHEPRVSLMGRVVLLMDDILDEGVTLHALQTWCAGQGAVELRTAVLVQKCHDRNRLGTRADYVGLEVPDRYVFGAGMDYKGYWRNVPGIYAVRGT